MGLIVPVLCAVFLIGLVVYRSFYWRLRGVPGPKSLPLIGNLHQLNSCNRPTTLQISKWTKRFGKVYGFQKGWRNFLVISDPQLVQEMLHKFECFNERETVPIRGNVDREPCVHVFHAKGQRWYRQRQLSTLIYSINYLKQLLPKLDYHICRAIRNLRTKESSFNIHPHFSTLTMDCISQVLLGNECNSTRERSLTVVIFDLLLEAQQLIYDLSWVFPMFSKLFSHFRLLNGKRKGRGLSELILWAYATVRLRKKQLSFFPDNNPSPPSLLDHFLSFESNDVKLEDCKVFRKPTNFQKALTIDEIAAQCCAFLIAGFGTSSSILAILTFYLAKFPEIQEKLRDEINKTVGKETFDYTQLNSMKYLDLVVREILRLYPVGAFAFGRRCAAPTTLGNLKVDKGTHVFVDSVSMHRNVEIWGADAEDFRPERWFENITSSATAYFPFGASSRKCIGRRLALMEIKLAAVRLLQNFRILPTPNMLEKPTLTGNFILLPESINVQLKEIR